jgi:C-terminal processing protease CtpA/Prc
MRRLFALALALPVAIALGGNPALAGGPDCAKAAGAANVAQHEHKKCNMNKEDCQKYMEQAKNRGWLGIEMDSKDGEYGMTITKVVPGSPASKAGFKEGDVLLSLNGVTLSEENGDKLKGMLRSWKPGDSVTYNVRRDGSEQNVTARLGTMPDEVYTAMVSEHMKEHTEVASR